MDQRRHVGGALLVRQMAEAGQRHEPSVADERGRRARGTDRDRRVAVAVATGELRLEQLDRSDVELLRTLLEQHVERTASTLAEQLLGDLESVAGEFVKVLPRDYAAVLATRQHAVDEGLDPDGDLVWERILEVTGG